MFTKPVRFSATTHNRIQCSTMLFSRVQTIFHTQTSQLQRLTRHCYQIHTQHTHKTHNNDSNQTKSNKAIYSGLIFTTLTIWYDHHKNYNRPFLTRLLPQIHAATVITPANLHGNRFKYNFIADVVEETAPAVVYIEIKDMKRVDYFSGQPMTASNGSGFIVKEDGLILTNAHVVVNKPHSRVDVRLHDGRVFTGVVEQVDTVSDLATVRIPVKGLKPLPLGRSKDLRPGEWVVAMGSPLTLSNTVTAGVVSSTSRGSDELGIANKDMKYIQTDAAITFGNSGGPLVNLDGEAIGVNSMKVTAGISFAIPSDYAKMFLESAPVSTKLSKGRRFMGITMITLSSELIAEMRERNRPVPEDVNHGVLVWKVILGSPAHVGGLLPGDIVTHINGKTIKSASDVYEVLSDASSPQLKMSIVRVNGMKHTTVIVPE